MDLDPLERVTGTTFLWNAVLFTRALHSEGLAADTAGAVDFARALTLVDVGDRAQVHAAGMALFVRRRDELSVYDAAFRRFWDGHELSIGPRLRTTGPDGVRQRKVGRRELAGGQRHEEGHGQRGAGRRFAQARAGEDRGAADSRHEGRGDVAALTAWSADEQLRHKPFERMTAEELRDAERLVDRMRLSLETRRTRRGELHPHGRTLAARPMLRRNLQHGGDLVSWVWRRPARRPRSIVVICDVSGSMERHSRLLIRFAQALRRASPVRTEAFVFGTHLTRVTRELAGRDADEGLARVSAAVTDWSGGTRIGASLRAFNLRWARRVLRSSGVVMIVSDGWDRGEPGLVADEMARLQRSCHRLVWLNPLAGSEHYQPLAAGMAAAYPWIDDLVAVNDLASLEHLGRLLAEMAHARSLRPDRRGRPRVHHPGGRARWGSLPS
jgi:hypothetical protein